MNLDFYSTVNFSTLPIFLQFGAPDRIFFIGSVQNGNIRTRFETVHTHHAFSKHKCLSGLADIFKERLVSFLFCAHTFIKFFLE